MKKKLVNELLLYPCPVVLVTTRYNGIDNVITISWTGIASSHPEYVTIAIKPERYSHLLVSGSMVFGINIPNIDLIDIVDYCGNVSGRNQDKFSVCKLTKFSAETIDVPLIQECPINIECRVEQVIPLGSHDLFIARVTNKLVNDELPDDLISLTSTLTPISYMRPKYFCHNSISLGYYGYTKHEY